MQNSSKIILAVLGFMIFAISSTSQAQAVAQAGNQCVDGKAGVLSCLNPDGSDDGVVEDVRLYINEEQKCVSGNVTAVDKSISGFVFSESGNEVVSKIAFSKVRTGYVDLYNNNKSLVMPTSATITNGKSIFNLTVTNVIEANYDGADVETQWHFVGSFQKTDLEGKVLSAGRLACSLL